MGACLKRQRCNYGGRGSKSAESLRALDEKFTWPDLISWEDGDLSLEERVPELLTLTCDTPRWLAELETSRRRGPQALKFGLEK